MSDYRAFAAVTASLQHRLQRHVTRALPGSSVRIGAPPKEPPETSPGMINVFLYQVTPHPSLRNNSLPSRASDGALLAPPSDAYMLHYIVSFYGDATRHEPELLLGLTLTALIAVPALQPDDIPSAAGATDLRGGGLTDQTNVVHFTHEPLQIEEMSRLWGLLVHTPYTLSIPVRASAVRLDAPDPTAEPATRGADV